MSGIYIPGMKMPTGNGELRLIIRSNGQVIISHKTHYEEAEAVPVPEHGRLIDADALVRVLKRCSEDEWNKEAIPFSWSYAYECEMDVVEGMPTIIPAEEGNT